MPSNKQLHFFKGILILWFIILAIYVILNYMNYIPNNTSRVLDTVAYLSIIVYFVIGIITPKFFNSISFSSNKSNNNGVIRSASVLLTIYFLTKIIGVWR